MIQVLTERNTIVMFTNHAELVTFVLVIVCKTTVYKL